jgi:UDP-N-acetylglucosamine--N-acetylmuramyl-(pentapeptide) pyrophosphoryl-undecaprenol N-acetylglucosamine transferase
MSARPVLIMAGGTGGHIFPGLALARALSAQGVPVRWLGSEGGLECRLVPEAGVALATLPISGLRGKGALALLRGPWRLLRAVLIARRLLKAQDPRCVVSFGGFAAGPGGLAAWLLRLPLIVHEQNAFSSLKPPVIVCSSPLPRKPEKPIASRLMPSLGTRRFSMPAWVPSQLTLQPRERISRATASPGMM